uniref:Phospholipid scramblase n=1 Tax=Macrostomum lignano TaxID=282301 RepID=A0A1I8FDQ6_9PLAT
MLKCTYNLGTKERLSTRCTELATVICLNKVLKRALETHMDKLAGSSSFKVKQQVEMLEALTGFETNNKYDIKDSEGKKVYKAKEHSGVCSRMCLGSQRPFRIEIEEKDSTRSSWRSSHACNANFSIRDANGDVMLLIEGPCLRLPLPGQKRSASCTREWGGLAKESCSLDADNFKVEVPNDTSVQVKSILVAAALLIRLHVSSKGQRRATVRTDASGRASESHLV